MSNRPLGMDDAVGTSGTAGGAKTLAVAGSRRPWPAAGESAAGRSLKRTHEVGVALCWTNTGGTSATGWYFITDARSAPRMSPLEW